MVRITMEDGGIIDIELNEEVAPITCENFKKLVGQGFYNGLTFHRVIPNFMIHELHRYALLEPNTRTCIHNYMPTKGRYTVPELPGLGQELTPETIAASDIITVK